MCLNFSVLPSPAERNCVIMLDSFYDSNQGYCLCKRLAPHCEAEQARHYSLENAEIESISISRGGTSCESRGARYLPLCLSVNTLHSLICNYKHTNKQISLDKFQSVILIQKRLSFCSCRVLFHTRASICI